MENRKLFNQKRTMFWLCAGMLAFVLSRDSYACSDPIQTVKIVNQSGEKALVIWGANGCAGMTSFGGEGYACHWTELDNDASDTYTWKWGTTHQEIAAKKNSSERFTKKDTDYECHDSYTCNFDGNNFNCSKN